MNRTHLLQLSADLDRVIELRSDDDESHWLRNTAATVGTVGTAGVGASYLAGRNLNGPFIPGTEGALGKIGRGSARIASYAGDVGRQAASIPSRYGLDRSLASRMPLNATGGKVSKISSILEAVKGARKAVKRFSARHENLLTLSAELDQVIAFDLAGIGKALWRGTTGRAALKWGGIGAAGGALAGGVSGALSDDPNKSAIGGALGGAVAGGALGAIGGGGMRAAKSYGRGATRATSLGRGMAPAAAPATATAAADRMAAASSQVAGQTTHGSAAYPNTSVADALAAKKAAQVPATSGDIPNLGNTPTSTMDRPWNIAGFKKMQPEDQILAKNSHKIASNPMNKPSWRSDGEADLAMDRKKFGFSSRLQSLVQLSAELESVVEFGKAFNKWDRDMGRAINQNWDDEDPRLDKYDRALGRGSYRGAGMAIGAGAGGIPLAVAIAKKKLPLGSTLGKAALIPAGYLAGSAVGSRIDRK